MTGDALAALASAIVHRRCGSADPDLLVETALGHRVAALLLAACGAEAFPGACGVRLLEEARLQAVHSALLDRELAALLAQLSAAGIELLVTKGAHLAHTLYSSPHLRPRLDSDLLIDRAQADAAAFVLRRMGYRRSISPDGTVILGEMHFQRLLAGGIAHYVDLHWRVVEPLVFEQAFDVAAMSARAMAVPALGPAARGPSRADALALACVHIVAHHRSSVLLLWLHDIHALADGASDEDRSRFVDDAARGRYRQVAACALRTAAGYFPSPALDDLIGRLEAGGAAAEPSAALTDPGRRKVDDLLLDLRVAGWRRGGRLLREHVLPPRDYMRRAFGDRALPVAYALRLMRGVRRWF